MFSLLLHTHTHTHTHTNAKDCAHSLSPLLHLVFPSQHIREHLSSYYVLPAVSGKDGHFFLPGTLSVRDFSVTPLPGFPAAPLATPSQVPQLTFPLLQNSTNSIP